MNINERLHDTDFDRSNRRPDKTARRSANRFSNLGIVPSLLKEINRLNFSQPTPIQEKSIPAGITGDDIIAIAQTGSGKTIAYGVPMLQRLADKKNGAGLVLVPTRELALQVEQSLTAFCRAVNMRSVVIIGGTSIITQKNALKRNPRIIIATPGRLMDLIDRKAVNLANIEIFVLDEADRMLDMGFIPDIKKIMKSIPEKHQTLLYSATMPREIEAIAKKLMENPTRLEVDRSGATPAEVSHEMFLISNNDKRRLLAIQLEQYSGPVLIFTRTKRMASKLTVKVRHMGFAAAEIHSNRSLGQRRNALEGFKQGRYRILIATDIAARGIDVSGIELVVNYDMPANSEDYVHRIGRTGRAGKTGHAISYATNDQRKSIKSLERFMQTKLAISALPVLPSEKRVIEKGHPLNLKNDVSDVPDLPNDKKAVKRKSSIGYHPKRRVVKQTEPKKIGVKRSESKRKDVIRKDSTQQVPKRKYPKRQNSQSAEFFQKDSGTEHSTRSKHKKNRSAKKKSAGQGSGRKKFINHY